MGNITGYINPSVLAKSLLINDLYNAGVTDIVGDAAYNWQQSLRKPKVPKALPLEPQVVEAQEPPQSSYVPSQLEEEAPRTAPSAGVAMPPKPKVIAVEVPKKKAEPVVIKEVRPHEVLMCVVAGAGITAEEKTLLTNIFTAMGKDFSAVGLTFIHVPEVVDEAKSVKMLDTFLNTQKAQNILMFGSEIGRIIWGCNTKPMQEMRAQKHAIFAQKHAVITYHPTALLRQPLLKKIVWHDVQNFMKNYKK